MIAELVIGAAVGFPLGVIGTVRYVNDTMEALENEADQWERKFFRSIGDLATTCEERDQLRQRVKDMQPMHDLGVRRHQTMQAEKRARKEARRAAREGVQA